MAINRGSGISIGPGIAWGAGIGGAGIVDRATSAPFVGVLDLLSSSALGAWSFSRALYTAKAGTNLFRLRRSSDNAESDFATLANGDLDSAAVSAWAGADTLYVRTLYDQSGNDYHLQQATTANQLTFSLTAVGTRAGSSVSSTVDVFLSPSSSAPFNNLLTGGASFHHATKRATGGDIWSKDLYNSRGSGAFMSNLSNKMSFGVQGTVSGGEWVVDATLAIGDVSVDSYVFDGTLTSTSAVTWRRNGSAAAVTGSAGSGSIANDNLDLLFGDRAFGTAYEGGISEFVIFTGQLSAGDLETLNTNSSTYYGV